MLPHGNWLVVSDESTDATTASVMIVNLKGGEFVTVLINHVIGDKVKVHVLDDPNDTFLAAGESIIRRGSKIFIERTAQKCVAYGTFTLGERDKEEPIIPSV